MTPTIKLTSTRKIWSLLTPVEQRGALVLLGLMFVDMALETLGVGLVIPSIALIMQGDFERNYPLFQPALNWLGNPSQQDLVVGGVLMLPHPSRSTGACKCSGTCKPTPASASAQLAGQMGVSLGKANYCLRALVEKGLVKLGNFSKNQNKRQYACLLTPAGAEEKTRITQAFLKCKEAEFEAIRREIEALKGELESSEAECQPATQSNNPSPGTRS